MIGEVAELTQQKVIDRIDEHARTLIAHSPFVLLATSAPDGSCDVSPRGDPAGSVPVLDEKTLPSMGTIMRDQMALPMSAAELDARLDERALTGQY
ncbi:pyridoxamine 5'-phosphate oxidase family protein [Amycolatopsis sp. CA-126428]|uniref:pyridoxamine 5'-phosphate oxidase family protein n=1 Tax=Amycolatopsis sp. CA-126428 TaxID=2073158 RepID=UPI001E4A437C|nr:pyridoxamine 5'-phosphate oxidase family protein [Amycolatopsis sp. CA-126428]